MRHDEKLNQLSVNADRAQNERFVDGSNNEGLISNIKPGLINKFNDKTYQKCSKDLLAQEKTKFKNKDEDSEETVTSSNEENEEQTEKERKKAAHKKELEDAEIIINNETLKNELKHKELIEESTEVGIMFASKPIIQAFVNPFVGTVTNKLVFSFFFFEFLSF